MRLYLSVSLFACSLSIPQTSFGLRNGLTCQAKEKRKTAQTENTPHTAGAALWRRQGGCAEDYADRPESTAEFHARHQTLEVISGLRAHKRLHCAIGLSLRGVTIPTAVINRKFFRLPKGQDLFDWNCADRLTHPLNIHVDNTEMQCFLCFFFSIRDSQHPHSWISKRLKTKVASEDF